MEDRTHTSGTRFINSKDLYDNPAAQYLNWYYVAQALADMVFKREELMHREYVEPFMLQMYGSSIARLKEMSTDYAFILN